MTIEEMEARIEIERMLRIYQLVWGRHYDPCPFSMEDCVTCRTLDSLLRTFRELKRSFEE